MSRIADAPAGGARALHPTTLGLVLALALVTGGAAAQDPGRNPSEGVTATPLDSLVVTADRAASPVGTSVAAASRVEGARLLTTAVPGSAEVLRLVPGVALVDRDGSGLDPQVIVRGFYGGGEAEYLVVLVDGRPLNALQSGLMAWDLVGPLSVEAVEVVRGSASALYGDAALGGVVNFITRRETEPGATVRLLGAGQGLFRGGLRASTRLGGVPVEVLASGLNSRGFRAHGMRRSANVGVSADLVDSDMSSLTASFLTNWTDAESPGPLRESVLDVDREASEAFYRFDVANEWTHRLTLDGRRPAGAAEVSAFLNVDGRRSETVRTIPLSPDFADTKERVLGTLSVGAGAQAEWSGLGPGDRGRFIVGAEASTGRMDTEHFGWLFGTNADYTTAVASRGASDASGDGRRRAGAAYMQLDLGPSPRVRLSLGLRYDRLADRFRDLGPSAGGEVDASHDAWSPKAGINVRWIDTKATSGHLYATVTRSFKAPTLDQLFDQRSIPIPFPPFSVTTSNAQLVPQRGTSVEVGSYHGWSSGSVTGSASLAAYRMGMRDEIDFDLATLSYVNVGESLHRGIEAEVRVAHSSGWETFGTYALQSARAEVGADAGRALRAIPRHAWSTGVGVPVTAASSLVVEATGAAGAWLDAENTIRLPSFVRFDVRGSIELAGVSSFVELRNAFDARYSTTGFPDPSGSGTLFFHPAAGRTLAVGMQLSR